MRILVVDDDQIGSRLIQFLLTEQGYQVETVDNARGALALVERQPPDLMLLDVNLPQLNGFEVYQRLREHDYDLPVIFVTAKGELEDRLQGLHMGADDYICKPFQPAELTARVEAVLRRYKKTQGGSDATQVRSGEMEIDMASLEVHFPNRRAIRLTPMEMKIFLRLAQHPGKSVSREDLVAAAWGENYDGESNIVDVYIYRLRRKIEPDPANPTIIQSSHGVGYKFSKV